jgi:flagellar biosynthesis/type III secretory pathway protein FliH
MGVIKADQLLARRARPPEIRVPVLAAAPAAAPPPVDPERVALEARLETLLAEVERLRAEAAEAQAAIATAEAEVVRVAREGEEARAAAEQAAHAAGLAEGAEAKAQLLARLESAADRAMDQFRVDLRGMETLAVALSKAALAKVFGDDREMAHRVARLVRRQVEALDRESILRVEVSAADFAAAAALDDFAHDAGLSGVEIKAIEELDAGDCRIRLRLGELEVGLAQQWSRLSDLLDDALSPEAR